MQSRAPSPAATLPLGGGGIARPHLEKGGRVGSQQDRASRGPPGAHPLPRIFVINNVTILIYVVRTHLRKWLPNSSCYPDIDLSVGHFSPVSPYLLLISLHSARQLELTANLNLARKAQPRQIKSRKKAAKIFRNIT